LRLLLPRPLSRRTSAAFVRDEPSAGSRPENTAAAAVDATVTASTRPFMSNVIHAGGLSRL
jgi:hypothetical protein